MTPFKYSSFWLAFKIYAVALLLHTIIGAGILTWNEGNTLMSATDFKFKTFILYFFWGIFFSGVTSFPAFILLWIIIAQLKKHTKDFHVLLGWLYVSTMLMAFLAAAFFMLVSQFHELPKLFYGLGSLCCAASVAIQHVALKNMWQYENRFQQEIEIIGNENLN